MLFALNANLNLKKMIKVVLFAKSLLEQKKKLPYNLSTREKSKKSLIVRNTQEKYWTLFADLISATHIFALNVFLIILVIKLKQLKTTFCRHENSSNIY